MAGSGRRMLAIDLGAESGRAVQGRFDGERLAIEEVHRFQNRPVRLAGTLHWDFPGLFAEVLTGIRKAAREGGLDSIGVDGWGVDFGLLDRRGRLLGNPVHYRDRRTEGTMERAFEQVPREELFARTGIQFMPINTLYQLVAMVEDRDPRLGVASALLTMPDLFHHHLCGSAVAEFTIATTTQCMDARERTWAADLLERLGIPARLFPEVVEPGTALGPLRPDVAEETRAGAALVVTPASHDTAAAVAAVPCRAGLPSAYISCGTWSLVGVEVAEPSLGREALELNLTNEGGVGSYRLLKNVMGLWLVQECRRAWAAAGREVGYDALVAMAGEAPAFTALIDPDDPRFLPPGDMPGRIRAYCRETGQPEPSAPGETVRLILEALALKTRLVLDGLERVTGRPVQALHLVGGGARNHLLCRLTAAATGLPVLAGPHEATAIGNLLVQAMAMGEVRSLEEGREVVARSFPVEEYEPQGDRDTWDARLDRARALFSPP